MNHGKRGLSFMLAAGLLMACSDTIPVDANLKLQSVTPNHGKAGITVSLAGTGLGEVTEVCFESKCTQALEVSDTGLKSVVPAGEGKVSVSVKTSKNATATLENAFQYDSTDVIDTTPKPDMLAEQNLLAGMSLTITGQNLQTASQVCFNDHCVQPSLAEKTRIVVTLPTNNLGPVSVSVHFGDNKIGIGRINISAPEPKKVGWCQFTTAPTSALVNQPSDLIFGEVFAEGCTPGSDKKCPNLVGEVGYLPSSDTANINKPENYTWQKAMRNPKFGGFFKHDEYMANLTLPVGDYHLAYRFSLNGQDWLYCDLDGGVQNDDFDNTVTNLKERNSLLKVTEPTPDTISYCRVQSPQYMLVAPKTESEPFYGQVYVAGCTDGAQKCEKIKAQLGYAEKGQALEAFQFVDAQYNDEAALGPDNANNDEYFAKLKLDKEGEYQIIYRFSLDGGQNWTHCDYDMQPGFDLNKAASLLVEDKKLSVKWCNVQHPEKLEQTIPKLPAEITYYGQVFVETCTERELKCELLQAQVGYAPKSENRSADKFDFVDALYNGNFSEVNSSNNDEYLGTLSFDKEGEYQVLYRFSLDNKKTWTYCDVGHDESEFSLDKSASLSLKLEKAPEISWCQLIKPSGPQTLRVGESLDYEGHVFVQNCTEGEKKCDGIKAQLGVSSKTEPKLSDFSYIDASYNAAHTANNNDSYIAKYTAKNIGHYQLIYRFSQDNGKTWTYCDSADSNDFDVNKSAKLNVEAQVILPIEWCKLEAPHEYTAPTGTSIDYYGQVYVQKCTDSPGACSGLTAELGYHLGTTPSAPTDFTFIPASFNVDIGNNDEFKAALKLDQAGEYRVIYRFSGDGKKTWSYCDSAGNNASQPFTLDKAGKLTLN